MSGEENTTTVDYDFLEIKRTVKAVKEDPIESVARGFVGLGFDESTGTSQEVYRILRTLSVWGMEKSLVDDIYKEMGLAEEDQTDSNMIKSVEDFLKILYQLFKKLNEGKKDQEKEKALKELKRHIHALARRYGKDCLIINKKKSEDALLKKDNDEKKYEVLQLDDKELENKIKYREREYSDCRRRTKTGLRRSAKAITLAVSVGEGFLAYYLITAAGLGVLPALLLVLGPSIVINMILFYPNAKKTFYKLFMFTKGIKNSVVCTADGENLSELTWNKMFKKIFAFFSRENKKSFFNYFTIKINRTSGNVWNLFLNSKGEEISLKEKFLLMVSLLFAICTGFVFGVVAYSTSIVVLGPVLAAIIAIPTGLAWFAVMQVSLTELVTNWKERSKQIKAKWLIPALVLGALSIVVVGVIDEGFLLNSFLKSVLGLHAAMPLLITVSVIVGITALTKFIFNSDSIYTFLNDFKGFCKSIYDSICRVVTKFGDVMKFCGYVLKWTAAMVFVNLPRKIYYNVTNSRYKEDVERGEKSSQDFKEVYQTTTSFGRLMGFFCALGDGYGLSAGVKEPDVHNALHEATKFCAKESDLAQGVLSVAFVTGHFVPNINELDELYVNKESKPLKAPSEEKSKVAHLLARQIGKERDQWEELRTALLSGSPESVEVAITPILVSTEESIGSAGSEDVIGTSLEDQDEQEPFFDDFDEEGLRGGSPLNTKAE